MILETAVFDNLIFLLLDNNNRKSDKSRCFLVISKVDINLEESQVQYNPLDQRSDEEKYIEKMFFTNNVVDVNKIHQAVRIFNIAEKLGIINKEDKLYLQVLEGIKSYQREALMNATFNAPTSKTMKKIFVDYKDLSEGITGTAGKALASKTPAAGMAFDIFSAAIGATGGGNIENEKSWNPNPVVPRDYVVEEKIRKKEVNRAETARRGEVGRLLEEV